MDEQQNQQPTNEAQTQPVQPVVSATKEDVEKNKAMAIIGYILPILFFIPLLNEETKKSPFAKFHANQQLIFLIASVIGWVGIGIISFIFAVTMILALIIPLLWLAYFVIYVVLAVMGIINASKGEMKKLPIIGGYEIIK